MADVDANNPVVEQEQKVDANVEPVQAEAGAEAPKAEDPRIPKARFDEVIAERNNLREERERLTQALLAAAQAREEERRAAPAPVAKADEEPEFDEQTRKVVEAIERRIFSKMGPVREGAESAKDMAEYATFHGQYVASGKVAPEMAQKVEGVVRAWRKAGVPGNRQDALWLIMGKELMEGKLAAPKSEEAAAARRHVAESDGGSPGPTMRLPSDFESLPAAKQAAILEKLLGDTKF